MFKLMRLSIPGRGAAERLGVLFFAVSLMIGVVGAASAGPPPTAPSITSPSSTTFHVGVPATFTVTTSGVPNPSLSETGTIPAGTTFVDNGDGTATLSGTPAAGTDGTFPITITASNGVSPDATQGFTLTVIGPVPTLSEWATIAFAVLTAGVGALALRRRRKA